jgi:hypothetical protein
MGSATPKPGYKTTEFWLMLTAEILSGAVVVGLVPEAGMLSKLVALTLMVLGSYGYTSSRAKVKSAS